MRTHVTAEGSQLYRRALARSWASKRPVEAYQVDGREPVYFVRGELLANADDTELIDDLLRQGGRVVRDAQDPPMPAEFRRLGLGRDHEIDMRRAPRTVKILFDEVPPSPENTEELLAQAWPGLERAQWTSESARALAALIAPMRARGKRVRLNRVGQPATLPLTAPSEGAGLSYPQNPLTWKCMNQQSRIADAWQLVESMRLMRSVSPVEFIGICDIEFDTSVTGNDIGSGVVRWNAATDQPGIPVVPLGSGASYHGVEVAGAAAAVVGNSMGAAGSGGTVAIPCFFDSDLTDDSVMTTVRRCTQWGIRIVNISSGHLMDQDDIEDDWVNMFNWAADNGVLIVCASPNEDVNLSGGKGDFPSTVSSRALAVGALREDDTWAGCAYGTGVDFYAPGTNIPLVPTPLFPLGSRQNGTSYAAPFVAGVAAMMRAVNSALTPDQLHSILINTSWPGSGRVNRGMDAYAAVWEAMRLQMTESISEVPPEHLFPAADGTFKPIFNDGFNRAGDTDMFLLEVKSFSRIAVQLRWYDRLTGVTLALENTDGDRSVLASVAYPASGQATLTADVGSGTYRLILRGYRPSAYLLTGKVSPGILMPDYFEPNNSFETATPLRTLPRTKWEVEGLSAGPFGPGAFDLSLHTDGAGPGTHDEDFFVITTAANPGVLRQSQVRILYSDEPIDVTLYDAARAELWSQHNIRTAAVQLGHGETFYLKVSGRVHTRYGLWAGIYFDSSVFERLWPELQLIPKWWEQGIDRLVQPEEYRGIHITPELIDDGLLTFAGINGQPLPEGVSVSLLDREGMVVSQAVVTDGRATLSLQGVREDGYVVSAALSGAALDAANAGGVGFTMRPPAVRPG